MEDTAIIRLFQERSQQAIAELSQKYGKLCQSLSRRILNNEEDAKECVNDTWLGVWNSIPPQTPNPLVSYVCRITRNLSVKRLRHNMAAKRNSYYDVSLAELEECIPAAQEQEPWEEQEVTKVNASESGYDQQAIRTFMEHTMKTAAGIRLTKTVFGV